MYELLNRSRGGRRDLLSIIIKKRQGKVNSMVELGHQRRREKALGECDPKECRSTVYSTFRVGIPRKHGRVDVEGHRPRRTIGDDILEDR